jgi:hypothetical protein
LHRPTRRPEQQHLTLGRFGGTDAAGFAAWLSESLAGQNNLLPMFMVGGLYKANVVCVWNTKTFCYQHRDN